MRRPRVIACYHFARLRKLPAVPAGSAISLIMPEQIQRPVNSERKPSVVTAGFSISTRPCACILVIVLLCFAGPATFSTQHHLEGHGESPSPSEAANGGIREVIPNLVVGPAGTLCLRQHQLIQDYNAILLTNGHDTGDPRLVGLVREPGRIPVEIAKEWEYQGEANALLYVQERIIRDALRRALARGIKEAIKQFVKWDLEPSVYEAQRQWSRPPVAADSSGSGR